MREADLRAWIVLIVLVFVFGGSILGYFLDILKTVLAVTLSALAIVGIIILGIWFYNEHMGGGSL